MTLLMPLLFAWTGMLVGTLWVLLFLSMVLLIAVILLQEGKGGGLAEAFGGVGAETFGVKAHGINKFTAIVGGIFLFLCVMLVKIRTGPDNRPLLPTTTPPGMQMPQFPPQNPPQNPPKESDEKQPK